MAVVYGPRTISRHLSTQPSTRSRAWVFRMIQALTVTLNFANLYVMIQCGEPKVQEQKNGNNTRFVRATDEQRET